MENSTVLKSKKKKIMKCLLPVFLFLLFNFSNVLFAESGWIIYHEDAFRGKVLDAATKEPIEDVVVVAIYRIREYGFVESNTIAVAAKEVLTNETGEFYIPPHTYVSFYPVAKGEATDFIIYKPGYSVFGDIGQIRYFEYFPNSPLRVDAPTLTEFFREGVTVELMKLKTEEERMRNIPGGPTNIKSIKLPFLFKAINEEGKRFGFEEVR